MGGLLVGAAVALPGSGVCKSAGECAWEVSKHPLWIAVVAWVLASWYQTRSRTRELRFKTFERCALVHGQLLASSWTLLRYRVLLQACANPKTTVLGSRQEYEAQEERAEAQLDLAYLEGAAIGVVNSVLFTGPTQSLWLEMLKRIQAFRFEEGLRRGREALDQVTNLWGAFIIAAAPEVSPQFRPVQVKVEGLEETRTQIDEFLMMLEPDS